MMQSYNALFNGPMLPIVYCFLAVITDQVDDLICVRGNGDDKTLGKLYCFDGIAVAYCRILHPLTTAIRPHF